MDAVEQVLELGADERISGVSCVHVQPDSGLLTNGTCIQCKSLTLSKRRNLGVRIFTNLGQVVEGSARSSAQGGRHEERHQSGSLVIVNRLEESGSAQAQILVGLEDAQFGERNHGRFLDARVRLSRSVADQFGQQDGLFDERVGQFQLADLLGARSQQRDQDALAGRTLKVK